MSQYIKMYSATVTVIDKLLGNVFQVLFPPQKKFKTFIPCATVTVFLSEICQSVICHYVTCFVLYSLK